MAESKYIIVAMPTTNLVAMNIRNETDHAHKNVDDVTRKMPTSIVGRRPNLKYNFEMIIIMQVVQYIIHLP